MTDVTIDGLTAASALTGAEIVPIVQGGNSRQTTAQNIGDLARAGSTSYTPSSGSGLAAVNNVQDALDELGADKLWADAEGQTVTGGWGTTPKSLGTITAGTVTPDPSARQMQSYTNNGAHTLAPSAVSGWYWLDITNGASAGAISTGGWTKVTGDAFTTTNGHKFRCRGSIGTAGSLLEVVAMQ